MGAKTGERRAGGSRPAGPGSRGPGGGGRFLRVSRNRLLEAGARPAPGSPAAVDPTAARRAASEIRSWPEYAATPLRELPGLARALGVGRVWLKDESGRLGLGSFKAVGGAYAVLCALQDAVRAETGHRPAARDLARPPARDIVAGITVTAATAGNHGRAVAWGAERFGCRCAIFLPADAGEARAAAIAAHGARIVRVEGDYDAAVRRADEEAARRGWLVLSDTSWPGYDEAPRRVMEGYAILVEEVLEQLAGWGDPPPTHAIVQAGVGGLAAAVCGAPWGAADAAPRFVVVEPWSADCIGRSLRAGGLRTAPGPFETAMTCLACGEPSPLAWKILSRRVGWALAVPDPPVEEAMRALAAGELGSPVELGPSGAAGVGALLLLAALPGVRRLLGLDREARVLALGTEGPVEAGVAPPVPR